MLLPGRFGALEITFVVVPIVAFFIRAWHGRNRLLTRQMLVWQGVVFGLAIFLLFVLDAMLIMMQLVKNGVPIGAWHSVAALYLVYLMMMAVAFFPASPHYNCGTVDNTSDPMDFE
jgi:hypothetical protein